MGKAGQKDPGTSQLGIIAAERVDRARNSLGQAKKPILGTFFALIGRMKKSLCRGERGTVMLEFALIAPLFILVMFAIISFGLLFSWRSVLNNAAREGARSGAVCKSDDEIRQIVSSNTALLPHAGTIVPSIIVLDSDGVPLPPGQRQRGGVISVTVSYQADVVAIPGILSATKNLTGQSTFRMECDAYAP